MTIRTVADVFTHLGEQFSASYVGRSEPSSGPPPKRVSVKLELTAELTISETDFMPSRCVPATLPGAASLASVDLREIRGLEVAQALWPLQEHAQA